MKIILHKFLAVFIIVAFLGLTSACERTITKYDPNGKPYHAKEFSAGQSLAALLMALLVFGLFIRVASSNNNFDGTFLYNDEKLTASLKNNESVSDSLLNEPHMKWVKVVDSEGNLIGRQMIDLRKLSGSEKIISHLDTQLSSVIDEPALMKLINDNSLGKDINSIPKSIEIEASYVPAEMKIIIKTVNINPKTDLRRGDSVLIYDSGRGIYRSITRENNKFNPNTNDLNQFRILVNQMS